ncbi:60S ribosomal protein L14 [Halocaridina rubra]|uniref:Large ribosomal subunit protein eL14 n=1 Tax=Halocaridina rubra TaxID=373956 RepID=A0AAN9A4T0_HALRR
MGFRKFVQIGRVTYLNSGRFKGKLATIVDIIDMNRALIDGPCTGVPRQEYKFSNMYLTKYLLKIERGQRRRRLRLAWASSKVSEKFEKSNWRKNIQKRETRAQMTDFDRYKLGRAKQSRSKIIRTVYHRLHKNMLKAKDKRLKLRATKKKAKKEAKAKM